MPPPETQHETPGDAPTGRIALRYSINDDHLGRLFLGEVIILKGSLVDGARRNDTLEFQVALTDIGFPLIRSLVDAAEKKVKRLIVENKSTHPKPGDDHGDRNTEAG